MKFFAILVLGLIIGISPASAQNNPWEGKFSSIQEQGDGTWIASVKIHGTRDIVTKRFRECIKATRMCRNQISGGTAVSTHVGGSGSNNSAVSVSGNCRNTRSTTCYAVFNPRYMRSDQVKNTEDRPYLIGECQAAGPDRCILVGAPKHDWQTANNIALDHTGWPLQRF